MPVIQAENEMEVEANHVYVIQPGKNMQIENGKLLLMPPHESGLNLPIDMFFRSLAKEAGDRAIAIILSGTGSDGSNGIRDIKEHDGMILVQDLETSKFDGMPRSAMRTGLVDAQISPEEIALEVQHISVSVGKSYHPIKTEKEIDEELLKKVHILLKKVSNINFTHYKQTTILRRIERRMMLTHKETLDSYVDYLYESPEEVRTLSKEVLIGVTNFFRDPEHFQCLKETAIQDILLHSLESETIRVWVAGCSTGEEAYSIAILFCEVMDALKLKRTVKIFATDLDAEAIATAGKGIFNDSIIDSVSPARLSRYFTRKNGAYIVNRDIRKMIVFSPHNVFQDPPFGRLDLISCRNMLIYFQPVLQNDLFTIFHAALKDGGYLFLGKSEAIGAFTEAFPIVNAPAKIFSHCSNVKIPGQKTIPYLQTTYMDDGLTMEPEKRYSQLTTTSDGEIDDQSAIDNLLLEQFMPACLVVNERNDIVHTYGDCSNYVHIPVGKFTSNVFELITEALRVPASTLLKTAREERGMSQYKNVGLHGERENASIILTAMPVGKTSPEQNTLYALVFSEEHYCDESSDAVNYDIDRVAAQRITDLEQDLVASQGKLVRSISEQECANEELQAANEELLTANEELQSSNEELQSVNEELYTVNSEYQQKLTELAELNDDIANFLSTTLTGIIFVDNKLNIRRYTDFVTTEFSVMDHDIGRSLKFISYHFPTVDIAEICDNVLKTLIPDEREIVTSKNKAFFMRVAPYRSTESKILGCVITLIDISKQKQGQIQLETTEQKLSIAQEAVEAKSDYLSRISHEIRTPMGALLGLIKEAQKCCDDKEALNQQLDGIEKTIEYMASIVTDISDASKKERDKLDCREEPFALRGVIDNVVTLVSKRMCDAGLTFEVSIADDFNPWYIGNQTSIQQILINFLNNSIKYTKEGGAVALKVFEIEKKVGSEISSALCFAISDTGIGIKPEFIPRLFDPFTRENSGDAHTNTSMGLGLSIAQNLVHAMNGTITVDSAVGKGSTFTIELMLKKFNSEEAAQKSSMDSEKILLQGRHLLIAEDNAINRKILSALLNSEGITCEEACDGKEAVKKFMDTPSGTFDCILMDMRMPELDGIRATEQIRSSNKTDAKTIPIIGVSANGFADDIKKAHEAGIDQYTTKPINKEKLLATIRTLLA